MTRTQTGRRTVGFKASRKLRGIGAGVLVLSAAAGLGCQTDTMLMKHGTRSYHAGNYPQARADFDKVAQNSPGDWKAQYKLGLSYLELGQPQDAQLALEKAQTIQADDPHATPLILDALAEAYYRQHRPDALAGFLQRTVDQFGTTRDYLRQAQYMARIGDLDSAQQAYQNAAYFADPDDARPYIALADFYESLGDEPKALQQLKYAYYLEPNNPVIVDRLRQHGQVPGPTLAEQPPKPEQP